MNKKAVLSYIMIVGKDHSHNMHLFAGVADADGGSTHISPYFCQQICTEIA